MTSGMRLNRRAQHAQRIHRLMIAVRVILCYLHRLQLLQPCLLGNLVLTLVGIMLQMAHVSDVTYIANLIAQVLQIAEHEVEGNGWTGMSKMGVTIDGWPTHIHTHIGGMKGLETLLLTRQRIIND